MWIFLEFHVSRKSLYGNPKVRYFLSQKTPIMGFFYEMKSRLGIFLTKLKHHIIEYHVSQGFAIRIG